MQKIKIACISDSIRLTSGFANVARPIIYGFHEALMEVYAFGTMDTQYDFNRDIPFIFQPSNPYDEMGHRTVALFLVNVQPDVIFILFDPGNLDTFVQIILKLQETGNLKKCPIVAYTPIEGVPIPGSTAACFSRIIEAGGKVVLYSPKMIHLINKQYPDLTPNLEWAYHGLDHANFEKYDEVKRSQLREFVGWNDFIVGSVAVNKRTKGLDTIIYTARMLRDLKEDEGIKFYLHTSVDKPTMWGYNLRDLAINYGVEDMFIFKPEVEAEAGGNIRGIDTETNLAQLNNATDKTESLAALGFIDRLNMLDCYLDLSQVEGWGLPAHEAMRCGVPTISVKDMSIREEVYDGGVLWLEPEPFRLWQTWHTGVKLVVVDPYNAAEAVIELKKSDDVIKKFWSDSAIKNASKYNWQPTKDKFVEIVNKVVEDYDYTV